MHRNLNTKLISLFIGIVISTQARAFESNKSLSQKEFDEIVKYYTFVGDFRQKKAERPVSNENFWKYPVVIPRVKFDILFDLGMNPKELPSTPGHIRAIQHMNRGRILFNEGRFEDARRVWTTAKSRYGQDFDFHRRNDYFIALAFLQISKKIFKQFNYNSLRSEVRLTFANTSTFLSWAFVKKKDVTDPFLDTVTAKGLYNLAAIYFMFEHYGGAHSTADMGLNFLRKTGRKELRANFRRIMAETWIRDHNYLRAIQEFDTIIRQEQNPKEASIAFSRVADIYFDLNNYEVAEEIYALAQKINQQIHNYSPLSAFLRGESLFWLGKFSQAQTMLQFAIDSNIQRNKDSNLKAPYQAWAMLRIADAFLARAQRAKISNRDQFKELIKKSNLAYFKVQHQFPKTEAAKIATIRRSCLELPMYEGKNIKHARNSLNKLRQSDISLKSIELAWSCEVLSYGERENNEHFVQLVKNFYKKFPESRYLQTFVPHIKKVRMKKLDEYINAKQYDQAILYYEKNHHLFPKPINSKQKAELFYAYVKSFSTKKAADFWPAYKAYKGFSNKHLISAVFLSEIFQSSPRRWKSEISNLIRKKDFISYMPKMTGINESYILRILNTKAHKFFLPWMATTTSSWTKKNPIKTCDLTLPITSKWSNHMKSSQERRKVWNLIQSLSKQWLPQMFSRDYDCALGLINLEAKFRSITPFDAKYAQIWATRLDWPQKKVTIPFIWEASEFLATHNQQQSAVELWTFLADQNPQQFPEVRFAKSRLKPFKSEVDALWQN